MNSELVHDDPHRYNPDVHYRLYLGRDDKPTVICVQDFDYPDYDASRFLSPDAWGIEMDALAELHMPGPPRGWPVIGSGMTNYDGGSIDDGFIETLQANKVCGRHSAWHFNGLVWYYNGRFFERVSVRHVPQATYSSPALRELMKMVNNEWGWE